MRKPSLQVQNGGLRLGVNMFLLITFVCFAYPLMTGQEKGILAKGVSAESSVTL